VRRRDEDEFVAFVHARSRDLRRTAFLLTGDWHGAEDVVQSALAKVYVAWPRIDRATAVAYARQVVVRVFLDQRRRRASSELPMAVLPEAPAGEGLSDDRLVLLGALSALPAGQRAAVVLRYWGDMSVREVAAVLRIAPGTVKSQCSRGLASLRSALSHCYEGGSVD
jgi:RNA polymerase sigma-70 factor (sigma-E family)